MTRFFICKIINLGGGVHVISLAHGWRFGSFQLSRFWDYGFLLAMGARYREQSNEGSIDPRIIQP